MSMLTPPGMGGKKFRVTGNHYPRMRRPRRRRKALAALTVTSVLGLLGYGTLQLVDVFSGDEDTERTSPATSGRPQSGANCAPEQPEQPRVDLPEPSAITVNVLNATSRTGLAQATADALAERGFTIGEVANAPEELDGKVEGPGLLLGTTAAEEAGALTVLATQLEGAETDQNRPGQRANTPESVDLVIGEDFEELTAEREAERRLAELAEPRPTPTEESDEAEAPAC
ncbi:LytR C-terminal domain-containing protein [Streptomyces millisiae]|uniref:LytR C-terminal domain-containing protein n=1 Tax=Streptomyces millisiae TaxID=3075542 RepID=A0ABU2LKE8_9ACTN|nr:LytR C-terminal domain-containing protein [Streptomyces sp. DSM 44918]MDT0318062.1 LytR C-terminal domain-containing protein [Streptomyces sp. DSM 44918]